jgi:hypothetical protein
MENDDPPDLHLTALEEYLRAAPILHVAAMPQPGINKSYLGILGGGVDVLLKPVDEAGLPEPQWMIRCEEAGWVLARDIGWTDLVAATVIREINSVIGDGPVLASCQVVWARWQEGAQIDDLAGTLDFRDRWRSALFDVLVRNTDRHDGNWGTLSGPPTPIAPANIKLIDHGLAFRDWSARPPRSTFVDHHRNEHIPEEFLEDVRRLVDAGPSARLTELLEDDAGRVVERGRALLHTGVLDWT